MLLEFTAASALIHFSEHKLLTGARSLEDKVTVLYRVLASPETISKCCSS